MHGKQNAEETNPMFMLNSQEPLQMFEKDGSPVYPNRAENAELLEEHKTWKSELTVKFAAEHRKENI